MASDWNERETGDEAEEADAGLLGGGGPAETMGELGEEDADEHGERLRAPESEDAEGA